MVEAIKLGAGLCNNTSVKSSTHFVDTDILEPL